ncbi:hypothetical protein MLD38_021088 [Melastoma candidum]|uniref:Uncharacterized protein n=1 Tax=Melastoma candidum TaxID=119954 RepID=A0ACB9QEG2_9MYRT|nr:hypothetical protein MLD38_021088 [Melastoma candidum]
MALHEMRLGEVKQHLEEAQGRDTTEVLAMVDALQRLAIKYHFEDEVVAILEALYSVFPTHGDLHEQALCFRLLRQEGFNVSLDMSGWLNIVNSMANAKTLGTDDILALASLHEASHLCMEEEDILEKIGETTARVLKSSLNKISDHDQADFVRHTLQYPVHKSLPIFTSKNIRDGHILSSNYSWSTALYDLALLDSSLNKFIYQVEVQRVSKWWKDLGLEKEMEFARHQPLKWYMWTMATLTKPSLSMERMELLKPISLIYVVDDIFDVKGTLEELIMFTNSIVRWSPDENLPEYMKVCFCVLDNITNEISSEAYRRHGWNPVASLRKSWGHLVEAFLVEARWFANKTYPSSENYLRNAVVTSGVHCTLVHAFFLLGEGITKQRVDILDGLPGFVASTATILRLWDDLGSAKDENQHGYDGSYLEYYKKEHPGCSDASARAHVKGLIAKEWKKLNQECLLSCEFPKSFSKVCLDTARMVPLMYDYDVDQPLLLLKELMNSILFGGEASAMQNGRK